MANWYVRSLAAGTTTGVDWTNAKLTLAAAFTAGAAGDSFFISEDHAETQASAMTLTSPGTLANPCFVYCVNHAGSVPPVSADLASGATLSTTGANSITFGSQATYWFASTTDGLRFQAGSAASFAQVIFSNNSIYFGYFKNCGFKLNNTSGSSRFNFAGTVGNQGPKIVLDNCTYTFGSNTGQSFAASPTNMLVSIRGGTVSVGASIPTTVFSSMPPLITITGLDLSAFGSGKTLIGASDTTTTLQDCKIGASVTVAATPTTPDQRTLVIRSDSGATNYRSEAYDYTGTETTETTIVRTGGASDGTTTIAHKIVTTANSKWVLPFEAIPIAIWNDTSGSAVTVTLYGIWGGGAVPNNDDIWMDVEYLGASANPQGSFISASKADNLATGSALTSDSSTWGGSTTAFKMSVTFTPQQKGAIYIYVKAAKASSTFYIDPKPVLS